MMSLLSPTTWLLYGGLAAALTLGAWRLHAGIEGKGYDRAQSEYTVAALKATEAARAREQQLQATVVKATHEAKLRETKLAADAAGARRSADSLRDQLTVARGQLPGLARDAVNQYAATATVVFEQCVRRYSDMAEIADRLTSDRQTLIDAWPK